MPGDKYASIQHPRQYRALRRRGFSKEAAARISNARTPGHTVKASEAIPPIGPHALFNQPGVGVRSARRRRRLKEFDWGAQVGQVISGNLTRGEGGRFSGSGGPSARQTLSAAQRKRRDEARAKRQARAAERTAAHEQELVAEEVTRGEEDAYIASGATGRERQRRRAEIAAKRRQRSTARREARRQEAAAERATRQQEDEAEQATRAEEEQAKPAKGGGGGGGGKAKPGDAEKLAEQKKKRDERRQSVVAQMAATDTGLSPSGFAAFTAFADGGALTPALAKDLTAMGLVEGDPPRLTSAGRGAMAAIDRGDYRDAVDAIERGRQRVATGAQQAADKKKRDEDHAKRDEERERARQRREGERVARTAEQARRAQEREDNRRARERQGRERTPVLAAQIIRNLAERRQRRRRKAAPPTFTVFKDAAGHDRWAAITTTAYQDKDGEWISRAAIRAVAAAGDAGQPRGPLRFWHVPGLDLGDCDYQAALGGGRMLLESGTFRSKAAAQIGAQAAQRGYQMSPGFIHTRHEPHLGVFNQIALFERSFVPPGRASNPYTRLLTKETRMLTDEKRKEFETLAGDSEGRALLAQLLSQAETTTKALDAAGAVYKDAPEWAQDLDRRLKAFETKAPMPAEEMVEAGATEEGDGLAELEAETMEEPASDLLDDEGFADLIVSKLLAQLGPLLEIEKKMASWAGEIKAALPQMAQQQATKDDARAREIADLTARLKELEGDQPRRSLTAGVWGDLTGISVTKEQAAQLTAQQPGAGAPAGLNGVEADAYKLIFGNE